jgi:hypothetical protein
MDPEQTITLPSGVVVLAAVLQIVWQLQGDGHEVSATSSGVIVNPPVHENCLQLLEANRQDVLKVLRSDVSMAPGGARLERAVVDRFLRCVDCGGDFAFTVGEQHYYAAHFFPLPKRCVDCRRARRARRAYHDQTT